MIEVVHPQGCTILEVHPDHALATWGNVFVIIWRNETTIQGVEAFRAASLQFAKAHPEGIGLLTIIVDKAPMPPSKARDRLAAYMRDPNNGIRASGVLFEGSGFRSAAVRSVVTGLTIIARQAFPHKVFANINDTADFLAPLLSEACGEDVGSQDIVAAVADIRSRVGAKGAVSAQL